MKRKISILFDIDKITVTIQSSHKNKIYK